MMRETEMACVEIFKIMDQSDQRWGTVAKSQTTSNSVE
jgi:hypothetical protein